VVYFDDYYGAEREGTQLRRSRGTFPRMNTARKGKTTRSSREVQGYEVSNESVLLTDFYKPDLNWWRTSMVNRSIDCSSSFPSTLPLIVLSVDSARPDLVPRVSPSQPDPLLRNRSTTFRVFGRRLRMTLSSSTGSLHSGMNAFI
jgi:hypothetical protein